MAINKINNYRADLDGLRAIAVLSVVVFHIDEALIPGGFVGVDIFFVLSGYLISRYIFEKLNEQSFSLAEFYRRRIKRIAPAMLVVLLVVLVLSQLIMLPNDAEKVAESVIWSLFSLTNFYFYSSEDLSYFASVMNEKPLLHFWTLGVEEQFYLIWPVCLMLFYRYFNARYFLYLLILLATCSFISAQYYSVVSPSFSYYMLPTRAGELLIGAIVAHLILSSANKAKKVGQGLSIIGSLMIVWSFFYISAEDIFPGILALIPTLGTAFIIYSGQYKVSWVSGLLERKPLVFVGLISYSTYLWHWPIIAFFNYGLFELSGLAFSVILLLTLLCGWLSFTFIEKPFRYSKWTFKKVFVNQLVMPSMAIMCLSLIFLLGQGYGLRSFSESYQTQLQRIQSEVKPAYSYQYICQKPYISKKDLNEQGCVVGEINSQSNAENPATETDIILIGDSNAAHYVGMLGEFANQQKFQFRNAQISACPPVMGNVEQFVKRKYFDDCRRSLNNLWPELSNYQTVIISASWSHYQQTSTEFLPSFFATVNALIEQGKDIIILGKVPVIISYNKECLARAISYPLVDCQSAPTYLEKQLDITNLALTSFAAEQQHVAYYDANEFLCENKNCSAYNQNGQALYFDQSHLSIPGSWLLGKEIVRFEGVPYPFNLLGE